MILSESIRNAALENYIENIRQRQEYIAGLHSRIAALEAQLAAAQQDVAIGRMLRRLLTTYGKEGIEMNLFDESKSANKPQFYVTLEADDEPLAEAEGADLYEALANAKLLGEAATLKDSE